MTHQPSKTKLHTYRLIEAQPPSLTIKVGRITRPARRLDDAISAHEVIHMTFAVPEMEIIADETPYTLRKLVGLLDDGGRALAYIPERKTMGLTRNPHLLAEEFSREVYRFRFTVTPTLITKAQALIRQRGCLAVE